MINVTVGRVPGRMYDVVIEGNTVREALAAANLTPNTGETIMINSEVATLDTVVREDTTILLTKQVKGN